MKKNTFSIITLFSILVLFTINQLPAQDCDGFGGMGDYIDENGDGFNDLAPDADGDGIPNGMDEDYVPPADGEGNQYGAGNGSGNGTGDCDGSGGGSGGHWGNDEQGNGPGDGTCPGECIESGIEGIRSAVKVRKVF